MHWKFAGAAATALVLASGASFAFELSPDGSSFERRLATMGQPKGEKLLGKLTGWGVRNFGKPVHEEIANRSLGCDGDAYICADPEWDPLQAYVLAGVRWNDDPPFRFEASYGKYSGCKAGDTVRLVVQPECWARVFLDGKKRAARGEVMNAKTAPLLLRSHFGDLQFLHAMASADGEPPIDTRKRILMWSEFTWNVSVQSIPPAAVHAAPGAIKEFHSYTHQDADEHAKADVRDAFSKHWSSGSPNAVDVGKTLVQYFERQSPWTEVQPYLECVFTLAPDATAASPGSYIAR